MAPFAFNPPRVTRILALVALLLTLPSLAGAQTDETLEERASLVRGSVTAAQTYLERAAAFNAIGDTAQVRLNLNQLRGRLSAVRTNALILQVIAERYVLRPDSLPVDTLPPIVLPPPDSTEHFARTLADTLIVGDVEVPADSAWLIGRNVRIAGNLRTDSGTIAMRPGSSLTFLGATREQYLGGGMRYEDVFANDWGIWVGGFGKLDIRGTPKQTWNRTGSHSSWGKDDELWITPTAPGDTIPRRWFPGDSIPQAYPTVPSAEIVNATRDVRITGGHIHISSSQPFHVEYARLDSMGVIRANVGAGYEVTGRYNVHCHMAGDGARNSVIRGVVMMDAQGKGIVPHGCKGVTVEDVAYLNGLAAGFWWDTGEQEASTDIKVDRLLVCGVYAPRSLTGVQPRGDAIVLSHVIRGSMTNSVACGSRGSAGATGFNWAQGASPMLVWDFPAGNVAHNNSTGLRIWGNTGEPHNYPGTVAYNNRVAGLENGAYRNANRWPDLLLLGNPLLQNTATSLQSDGLPGQYERLVVRVASGPAIIVSGQNLPSLNRRWEFSECTLENDGSPLVQVNRTATPWTALFKDCGVTPADFAFAPTAIDGHSVWIQDGDLIERYLSKGGLLESDPTVRAP